jgi:hypothetical protein
MILFLFSFTRQIIIQIKPDIPLNRIDNEERVFIRVYKRIPCFSGGDDPLQGLSQLSDLPAVEYRFCVCQKFVRILGHLVFFIFCRCFLTETWRSNYDHATNGHES